MKDTFFKTSATPTLFENLLLNNQKAVFSFLYVLIPFISGFNIYCAMSGRTLASVTLCVQLVLFIIFLYIFKPPSTHVQQLMAIRYVVRTQLIIFAVYMIVVVGIRHQYEVAPWSFLFIFLLFLSHQNKRGCLFAFGYIFLLLFCLFYTAPPGIYVHKDYWVRHFFSLLVFTALHFCSLLVRNQYLKNLSKTKSELELSEKKHRELSQELMSQIKQRDAIEKKLHQAIKMETLGNIAAGVAHDLNNILSGISTYPDLLLMNMPENDPKRKQTEMIRDSGFKAAAIVEDLLTLTRRGVHISEVTDLQELIKTHLASPEHEKVMQLHPGIRVNTHISSKTLNILGSAIHLSKAFMNLILNAAEAMPDGGDIHIHLETRTFEKKQLLMDTLPYGRYSVLTVEDNGLGIPKDSIEHIFEPFFSSKKMGRSGTGLGMAIVIGTIKDHQAFIDVQSEVGKGTVVSLYFPVTSQKVALENKIKDKSAIAGNGEKILVIDDVPEQRFIAVQILEELNYNAFSCASGEDAVMLVSETDYDLLIIDMIMDPGMNGYETYREILKSSENQKAIIATGFSEDEKIKKAQALGAGPCLSKPYSPEELGLAVKKELN